MESTYKRTYRTNRLSTNVQRRSSKLVPGMSNLSYKDRLKLLKLPTLKYRRYRGDMIEVYKLSHGYYDKDASNGLIDFRANNEREYDLRGHRYNIRKDIFRKNIKKYSFKGRVTEQWNNLPASVVEAPSLNAFKSRLDKLWDAKDIIFDPDIDINEVTSQRNTRYATIL